MLQADKHRQVHVACRFMFVIRGAVNASMSGGRPVQLREDQYAYFPAAGVGRHRQVQLEHACSRSASHARWCSDEPVCSLTTDSGAGVLLFERLHGLKVCQYLCAYCSHVSR